MSGRTARFIVLGMHRSGTSLLAHLLKGWGAQAGSDDDLMAPDENNPKGYMESWALVRFNEELLARLGSSWSCPPGDAGEVAALLDDPALRARAEELVGRMDRLGSAWLWKDPRLAVLLPFWAPIWREATYLIPVRDPLESAMSLERRDRLPISAGLLLWQFSMSSILSGTLEARRIFVDFAALCEQPAEEVSRLATRLGAETGDGRSREQAVRAMLEAVSPALHRQKNAGSFFEDCRATDAQKRLYAHLSAALTDPELPFDLSACPLYPGWRDYLFTLTELHALLARRSGDSSLVTKEHELRLREQSLDEREEELAILLNSG